MRRAGERAGGAAAAGTWETKVKWKHLGMLGKNHPIL
uniref:Uncharacterized protein n=1 Tax=Piliocolobus tephrosceles TaxID=591936 RepID=A0A8C9GFY2_9PRIM